MSLLKNIFSFEGRIKRSHYWISLIIFIYLTAVINTIIDANELDDLFILTHVPLLWFIISKGARRCHDRGKSGFFQLIPFYPFFMLFGKSKDEINKYDQPINTERIDVKNYPYYTTELNNNVSEEQHVNYFSRLLVPFKNYNRDLKLFILFTSIFLPVILAGIVSSVNDNQLWPYLGSFSFFAIIFWLIIIILSLVIDSYRHHTKPKNINLNPLLNINKGIYRIVFTFSFIIPLLIVIIVAEDSYARERFTVSLFAYFVSTISYWILVLLTLFFYEKLKMKTRIITYFSNLKNNLNKGFFRLITASSFVLPVLLAFIVASDSRSSEVLTDFLITLLFSTISFWLLAFIFMWIYEGFKSDKN